MNKSSLIFYKQVIPFGMAQSIFYTFLSLWVLRRKTKKLFSK